LNPAHQQKLDSRRRLSHYAGTLRRPLGTVRRPWLTLRKRWVQNFTLKSSAERSVPIKWEYSRSPWRKLLMLRSYFTRMEFWHWNGWNTTVAASAQPVTDQFEWLICRRMSAILRKIIWFHRDYLASCPLPGHWKKLRDGCRAAACLQTSRER